MVIDNEFINEWHPKYDRTETDEEGYNKIIAVIADEISKDGTITKETFLRILDWKSSRVKGIIDSDFEIYKNAIKTIVDGKSKNNLKTLTVLRGIKAAVASTILHLIYPDKYAIIDKRTVETLYSFGQLKFGKLNNDKSDDDKYAEYNRVIHRIKRTLDNYTLREIDRALFAYHKLFLEKNKKDRC